MIISLITALIEFSIFFYLLKLFFNSRNRTVALSGAMVFLLATYQLSEYMLCNTTLRDLWARIGFATYTFLPVVSFNLFLSLARKKPLKWVYVFPIFFSLLALLYDGFIVESVCRVFHVSVNSLVFRENITLLISYLIFYSFFPTIGVYIFVKSLLKVHKNSIRKLITTLLFSMNSYKDNLKIRIALILLSLAQILGVLFFILYNLKYHIIKNSYSITTLLIFVIIVIIFSVFVLFVESYKVFLKFAFALIVIAFGIDAILYIISTQFSYDFSSMWCHFAFLYSIVCLIVARIVIEKHKFYDSKFFHKR